MRIASEQNNNSKIEILKETIHNKKVMLRFFVYKIFFINNKKYN